MNDTLKPKMKYYCKFLIQYGINQMFMFHYQPNQNTGCKVKSVVNMSRQLKRSSNRRRSEQPFYLPRVYPGVRGFTNAVFS